MQILLTGGSGAVGKSVVERLAKAGHKVRVIGRRADVVFEGAEYLACDINNYIHLREVIRGCEAVVHLAALPNPSSASPEETFRVNALGTFNVFQAAAEEGIRRVIQASSINAAGQFYGIKPAPLLYLPLDEQHPVSSTDVYSFSKHVIEDIGDYFWRREGITTLAYRLPYVAPVAVHQELPQRRALIHSLAEQLLKRSSEERRAWFDAAWKAYNDFRAQRPYEQPGLARQLIEQFPDDKRAVMLSMTNRVNFFTMLDERDSAQAIEKGLTVDFQGSRALFINDALNWTGLETSLLIELFYPDVTRFTQPLEGRASLVSIEQARQLIGFEPQFTFGDD
jgi:nucleoside-diphosphate-sugar epimerase